MTHSQLPLFPRSREPLRARNVPLALLPADSQLPGAPPSAGLMRSIKRFGVLYPILLDGYDQVMDGRRRIKAARKAGLTEIPALKAAPDWAEPSAIAITVNELRTQNLASTLANIEELRAKGYAEREIMDACGLEPARYKRVIGLLRLIPELRAALAAGQLRESTAEDASRMAPERQRALLPILRERGRLMRTDTRKVLDSQRVLALAQLPDPLSGTPWAQMGGEPDEEGTRALLLDFVRWMAEYSVMPGLGTPPEEIVGCYLSCLAEEVHHVAP